MSKSETMLEFLFPIAIEKAADGIHVKGFASTESVDSIGDLVSPDEFNAEEFIAGDARLSVDHKKDHTAGRVVQAYTARVVAIEDDSMWGVQNLKTGEVTNTLPRDFAINLQAGDRGLFVVAEVHDEQAVQGVLSRALTAFSWRGQTTARRIRDAAGNLVARVLAGIELIEISLTGRPVNENAVMTVGKSVNYEDIDDTDTENDLSVMEQFNQGHDKMFRRRSEPLDTADNRVLDSVFQDIPVANETTGVFNPLL